MPLSWNEIRSGAVAFSKEWAGESREHAEAKTFWDLYDPLAMPAKLTKAHAKLDRAVDRCYRSQPFPNERNRVEYLFKLYQKLTAPLLPTKKGRG